MTTIDNFARLREAEREIVRLRAERDRLFAELAWRAAENKQLEVALVYQARLRSNLQCALYEQAPVLLLQTDSP